MAIRVQPSAPNRCSAALTLEALASHKHR
jgi:hypothetical protein